MCDASTLVWPAYDNYIENINIIISAPQWDLKMLSKMMMVIIV